MSKKTNATTERRQMCTTRRAAYLLDCSERTIRRLCEEGHIKAVKLSDNGKWRVNVAALCEQYGIEG